MKHILLTLLLSSGLSIVTTQSTICSSQQVKHEIILYTYSWCPPCKAVKKFIKDNNLEKIVKIVDADLEVYADELYTLSGKDICPYMYHVNENKTKKGSQDIIKYLKNLFNL